jgi:hypothetical protein
MRARDNVEFARALSNANLAGRGEYQSGTLAARNQTAANTAARDEARNAQAQAALYAKDVIDKRKNAVAIGKEQYTRRAKLISDIAKAKDVREADALKAQLALLEQEIHAHNQASLHLHALPIAPPAPSPAAETTPFDGYSGDEL